MREQFRGSAQEYSQRCQSLKALLVLQAQLALSQMGFGGGPFTGTIDSATEAAVRRFESVRHLPITGNVFTDSTLQHLLSDHRRVGRLLARATLPEPFWVVDLWEAGDASVFGAWTTEGDSSEQREVNIWCDRAHMECVLGEALLFQSEQGVELSAEGPEIYRISSWDRSEILATRILDEAVIGHRCERATLRLNRVEKSASRTRSAISRTGTCNLPGFAARSGLSRLVTPEQAESTNAREQRAVLDSIVQVGPTARAAIADVRAMGAKIAHKKQP